MSAHHDHYITDNVRRIANSDLPEVWVDPVSGGKLYNEAFFSKQAGLSISKYLGVLKQGLLAEMPKQQIDYEDSPGSPANAHRRGYNQALTACTQAIEKFFDQGGKR